jgi:hypothetical protein
MERKQTPSTSSGRSKARKLSYSEITYCRVPSGRLVIEGSVAALPPFIIGLHRRLHGGDANFAISSVKLQLLRARTTFGVLIDRITRGRSEN